MARPPMHPVEMKLKIVLSVLSGQASIAEAARRNGISETSIGKWKNTPGLDARRYPGAIQPSVVKAGRKVTP